MQPDNSDKAAWPDKGVLVFTAGFLILSLLLLSQIGDQTVWKAKTKLAAQPRFWPAIGLGGMVLFSALHLWRLPRKRPHPSDLAEAGAWFAACEYALWFLAYVWVVPMLGYLPTTLIFVPLLGWRLGYRSRRFLISGLVFAFAVVVLFKSLLQVRIPGGAVYEYLPVTLRNFFILNF